LRLPHEMPPNERLLDLNISYLSEDASDRLLQKGDLPGALAAARTAERYAPEHADTVETLAFLEYLSGDKAAALKDFQRAKTLDPDFKKGFDEALESAPELRPLRDDKEFLGSSSLPVSGRHAKGRRQIAKPDSSGASPSTGIHARALSASTVSAASPDTIATRPTTRAGRSWKARRAKVVRT